MANKRMISYKLFENYQFSQLTDREKLIYIGLIVIADDEGRFKADPRYLRAKLFPFEDSLDENRVSDISRGVNKLNGLGLVRIWQTSGEQVGEHPNWKKYQNLREDRIKKSDILPQDAAKCPHSIREYSIREDKISKDSISTTNVVATKVAIRKDIEIINLFASIKGITHENTKQRSSFIKRNLRAAGLLTGYPLDKIKGVMIYLEKTADYKYTLETVSKFIDENPNKLMNLKRPKQLD